MIVVAGGCSFTDGETKWPYHLARELNADVINTGLLSSGNGLISRKIIYRVSELLKTTKAEDILVGVMWSGSDRHDFYNPDVKVIKRDGWKENPSSLGPGTNNCWILLNHHWSSDISKMYYGNFHHEVGSMIYTLEHILRVQWFLKLHNIRYFMTTFNSYVLPARFRNHDDIKNLYGQVDFTQFLPIDGQYEWANRSGIPYVGPDQYHPNNEQNKKFTQEIILPFLKEKNYI